MKPLSLLLLIATALPLAAADKVVGGPVVVNVTQRTATVVWVVQSGEARLRAKNSGPQISAPALRAEKATFTGLQPGTSYEYDVPGNDAAKGVFKTPPAGAAPFEFVVFGDTRTRHDVHRHVMEAVLRYSAPDFVVHTGDLVANGNDSALWTVFFDIEKELLRKCAFFPSLGNHERNSRDYYDFFQVGTPYYSFNWGNAHFAVLNSDIGNAAISAAGRAAFWKEQTRWLEEDLQNNQKADFRFLAAHHPPFSAVARRQGSNPEMTALVPMLEKYRLTAGFFGHDHNYQHYLKDGVHYVITGGGGSPLYDVDKPAPGITQKVVSVEHFVRIRVDGQSAHIEAIAMDGHKLDDVVLNGGPAK